MYPFHSRQHRLCAAISLILALLPASPVVMAASTADPEADARRLDGVEVEARRQAKASSVKYTQPLLDTPQTISQIPREVIDGQNLLGLHELLSTLPGITFGAGEGGGGYGDSINLRGFSSNNDITVDGVRDSAQYTRSDTFNLESVEVVNGANSVNSGAGAVGGSINLVSKVATAADFHRGQLGLGSDGYARATADSNMRLGESAALRLNAMYHQNDLPGRDVETAERWGFAPSFSFGLDSGTSFSLSTLHQEDKNTPQYGVPYFNGGPLPGVDPSTYFGYRNVDRQDIEVDVLTARLEHEFNENISLHSITRHSTVDQFVLVNPPQGTYCLDSGINPATGASCSAPGTYLPSGPRGTTRDTTNKIALHQTDLLLNFTTGAIRHDLVAGFSLSHESYDLLSGNSLRNPGGATPNPTLPITSLSKPDTLWTGPVNFIPSARQAGELDNRALYLLDTLKFSDTLHLNLGGRYERNEGSHRTDSIATPVTGGAITTGPEFQNNDDLFSYRAGLVYKPAAQGTLYLSHGNSRTPSKASVNGACTAQTCSVDPETAVITELGAKWDFYDGRLELTGALFRNDRKNYKVADANNPDNPSGEQQLDGQARVDGLLLGATGRISDDWFIYANYARLESEVLQGVSDFTAAQGSDFARGDRLTNTPENSAGVWTTYDVNPRWQLGYGATYLGKVWLTQHSATNPSGPLVTAPGYWVHRAMLSWNAMEHLQLQLNVHNLFDKEYYTRPRNNGWSVPGATRYATLTANIRF